MFSGLRLAQTDEGKKKTYAILQPSVSDLNNDMPFHYTLHVLLLK